TATDNLASALSCDITIAGTPEAVNDTVANGTVAEYTRALPDGSYNWSVTCRDQGQNSNTITTNFTVDAPPRVTLTSPILGARNSSQQILFNYTPEDYYGIESCTLYLDGTENETTTSVSLNTHNAFNISGVAEGDHNWTVSCVDDDLNTYAPSNETFSVDLSGPLIAMNYPQEGAFLNIQNVTFNWTPTDYPLTQITCDITIDGAVASSGIPGVSGGDFTHLEPDMTEGPHNWSVTCSDDLGNQASSITINFTINQPDMATNNSLISINDTNPNVLQNVTLGLNVSNIGGSTATDFIVAFYDNVAGPAGQIGNVTITSLAVNASTIASITWLIPEGRHQIYGVIDPQNDIGELNESNNNATLTITTLISRINAPASGYITNSTSVPINFTVADYVGGTVDYAIYVDGSPDTSGTANDNESTIETLTLADGTYTIFVRATDGLSRQKDSTAITVTVDTGAPDVTFQHTEPDHLPIRNRKHQLHRDG
ncbi:MAG: hypothetical protein HC945_02045, partial [Nitrosarchaeum sp.]|nr:hypothetical protein [Nitrosarchaeum sp.]